MPSVGRSVLPWQAEAQGGTSSGLRSLGSHCGLPMVLGTPRGPQRSRSERYRPCPQHALGLRTKAHLTSLSAMPQRFNKVWVALFLIWKSGILAPDLLVSGCLSLHLQPAAVRLSHFHKQMCLYQSTVLLF